MDKDLELGKVYEKSLERQGTIKDQFVQMFNEQPGKLTVSVENVDVWVDDGAKQILHSVNAEFQPGKLIGILGPSGSGKTTLLNALTGQLVGKMDGKILVNGQRKTKQFKRKIGYVMQSDLMFSQLTVEETLQTTAWLRLPEDWSAEAKQERVDRMIRLLQLQKTTSTKVGKALGPSISGGEKKRLNVANELMTNPAVLFLDEPTSGLDSTTAKILVDLLKEIARGDRTIVTSIHQPSSYLFYQFDQVVFLSEGRVVYDGPPQGVVDYFSIFGLKCPDQYNPADFALDICNDPEISKKLPTYSKDDASGPKKDAGGLNEEDGASSEMKDEGSKWPTSWTSQFRILLWRAFVQKKGDIFTNLETGRFAAVGLMGGLCWFQIKREEPYISDYIGSMFFLSVFLMFMIAYGSLIQFMGEENVIKRERRTGAYRLSAYYFAKIIAEWPVEFVYPLGFLTGIYWMSNWDESFVTFLKCVGLLVFQILYSSSLGTLLGAAFLDFKKSQFVISVVILSMMLLGGYYVNNNRIPVFIGWAKWLSGIRYCFNSMILAVVPEVEFKCGSPSEYELCENADAMIRGPDILEFYGLDKTSLEFELGMLVVFTVLFRVAGYYFLSKNMR